MVAISDLVRSCKMDNVTFIEYTNPISGEVIEHAIIDNGDGSFTSMNKKAYEAQEAEQSTPILPGDAN
jgi:hypothetical protein